MRALVLTIGVLLPAGPGLRRHRYADIKPASRSLANDVLVIYDEMRAGR